MAKCHCGDSECGMYFRGAYYCPLCLPDDFENAPNYKRQPIRSVDGGEWEALPAVGSGGSVIESKGESDE